MSKKGLKRVAEFTLESEGFSIHTLELSCQYTEHSWKVLKDKLYQELEKRDPKQAPWIYAEDKQRRRYICTRYSDHGVRITLERNESKSQHNSYFVRMVINPRKLLDPKASYLGILEPTDDCIRNVSKTFQVLFKHTPFEENMDMYYLTRVDLCTNVRCSNSKIFRELIRASQKLPTPAKLKRKYYKDKDKERERRYNKHYIRFICGSYEMVMYDKTYHLTDADLELSYEKLPEGVLRYEIRVFRGAIRSIEKEEELQTVSDSLSYFVSESKALMLSTFSAHFPPAVYMRQPDLLNYILNYTQYQDYTKYNMVGLVHQVGKSNTVTDALEHMKKDKATSKALLDRFTKLGLSPIPLRKNFSAAMLPNPTHLLMKLASGKPVTVEYIRSK